MAKKVTLIKSLIAAKPNQKATAASLGLRKIGDSTVQPDNPQTRGKLAQISYLVSVTEDK